jgi:hypothetical protein
LDGLTPSARRLAVQLLERFTGWTPATLQVLRNYARSSARLEALQQRSRVDPRAVYREIRANLALLRELDITEEGR